MIEVTASYVNLQKVYANGNKTDYFVYTDLLVQGHASHTGYTTNTKVCAGISACCNGIKRLIADYQYQIEIRSGYFHVWTNKGDLRALDKDTVYALNTCVCQLYEIYKEYPRAFKSFELIDVKENYDYEKVHSNKPKRYRERKLKLGTLTDFEE